MTKTRTATPAPRVALHLRTREDLLRAVDRTSQLQLDLAAAKAARDAQIAAVKATHAEAIEKIEAAITLHLEAAADYATAFPAEIFAPGTRTGETQLATYGLRLDPASIKLFKKVTEEDAISMLKSFGLTHLIRTKEELDKEKLADLADHDLAQCGLKKVQADRFFVKSKEETGTRTTTAA